MCQHPDKTFSIWRHQWIKCSRNKPSCHNDQVSIPLFNSPKFWNFTFWLEISKIRVSYTKTQVYKEGMKLALVCTHRDTHINTHTWTHTHNVHKDTHRHTHKCRHIQEYTCTAMCAHTHAHTQTRTRMPVASERPGLPCWVQWGHRWWYCHGHGSPSSFCQPPPGSPHLVLRFCAISGGSACVGS